jgi:hypothetical protein
MFTHFLRVFLQLGFLFHLDHFVLEKMLNEKAIRIASLERNYILIIILFFYFFECFNLKFGFVLILSFFLRRQLLPDFARFSRELSCISTCFTLSHFFHKQSVWINGSFGRSLDQIF